MGERRAYRVSGRVQGVGFRWFARQAATELGLTGSVRNASDGTVEVVAEGERASLETFEDRLRSGPGLARVDDVEALEPPSGDQMADFRIIR